MMDSSTPYQPTAKEIFALVVLMAQAGEAANPRLEELARFRLDGEQRRRLNRAGLVASTKVGRSQRHRLTDEGWAFCRDLAAWPYPAASGAASGARSGAATGTLYAVLGGLAAALERHGLSLREFFAGSGAALGAAMPGAAMPGAAVPGAEPGGRAGESGGSELESRIRTSYQRLAGRPGAWVGLADLRPLLGPASRDEVDAALTRMALRPGVHLIPIANLKSLTSADRDAALRLGGEDNHAMAIETA